MKNNESTQNIIKGLNMTQMYTINTAVRLNAHMPRCASYLPVGCVVTNKY